jgi:glycerate kinase
VISFLLAPDSLKGSLSALQACAALERGARRALSDTTSNTPSTTTNPSCYFTAVPLADGGEGTVAALVQGAGGELRQTTVRGPLGEPVQAQWAILSDGRAVIEMAQASGLTLVPPERRSAIRASSYGTGEIIRAALDAGCRELLVGIGGSATTDGGAGTLQALGARLLNEQGADLPPGGAALYQLAHIDTAHLDQRLAQVQITILCDVTNPLYGSEGASYVYGPQKGASPDEVEVLDAALRNFARVAAATTGQDLAMQVGAGAAGGIGFGLMTFAGARLTSGIEMVLAVTDFARKLETADLVLTAEGSIDAQTPHGKALAGVARAARAAKNGHGVPVIAFGGAVNLSGEELHRMGIVAALPLPDAPISLSECVACADDLLSDAAERAVRLWLCGKNS